MMKWLAQADYVREGGVSVELTSQTQDMIDSKPQQGAFTAFVRRLLRWGSDSPPVANDNGRGSSTKSKRAESVYSSCDPSTDVSSLAPSALSLGHSSHGMPNSMFVGNSYASSFSTPPPAPDSPDLGSGTAPTSISNAPAVSTHMVVSVVEPVHNPNSTSRTSSYRAADTASVLTIASSSKRRRRRSIDTNASTRALFAESIFSTTDAE